MSEQKVLREKLIAKGVNFIDANTVYLREDTDIAEGVLVEPFVVFGDKVKIGKGCTIKAFSHIEQSIIGENCLIGPFARIRSNTIIGDNSGIGNFVEVARSTIGKNSPAWHLSFIGDSEIGDNVGIGAGMVTCNFDGVNKNKTAIEDNVFVGSQVTLVAPARLAEDSLVAAGSVVSQGVEKGALAISRAPLIQKPDGAAKYFSKKKL
ncbi:MAG: hypothetical protein LBL47_00430 [Lactobacillus sp.]|jgi:bifunctional UDP-N-acetylglucosamine pyrophosphorylase/glucosamine-1-phosphate N-acetyltransferase|nr:hypothetical protein [Lactobacillus sp.]